MDTLPWHSRAALDAGLPARFLYWQGRSRQRYLFTRTSLETLSAFEDAVVIVTRDGTVIWAGEAGSVPQLGEPGSGLLAYVHLLASGAAERRAVIEDLQPFCPSPVAIAA
jgi:hypothetical protein